MGVVGPVDKKVSFHACYMSMELDQLIIPTKLQLISYKSLIIWFRKWGHRPLDRNTCAQWTHINTYKISFLVPKLARCLLIGLNFSLKVLWFNCRCLWSLWIDIYLAHILVRPTTRYVPTFSAYTTEVSSPGMMSSRSRVDTTWSSWCSRLTRYEFTNCVHTQGSRGQSMGHRGWGLTSWTVLEPMASNKTQG